MCFPWISGFTPNFIPDFSIQGISEEACFKDIPWSEPLTTQTTTQTDTQHFPNEFQVHNVWYISWQFSDTATLSPPPPQFSCTTSSLKTWVPGETVDPKVLGVCDGSNSGLSHADMRGYFFLVIGLPLIGSLVLGLCCASWCRKNHKRSEARRAMGGPAVRETPAPSHT
jgi:hypothetical protein